ncbi:MAG: phosphate acetyltransferase [Spirochaetes bacterium GWF1_51_8]|nr:MAG: phosphate acetyltransferase [Spirochaetes bacterium GWF1_51_8]
MLDFKGKVLGIARETPRRLVLPEGQDIRVLRAAEMCMKEKIVSELYVLGDPDELTKKAKDEGISLSGIYLRDPKKSEKLEKYSSIFYENRKHKGMTEEEAHKTLSDEVYYGAMMLKQGEVDAMVSGSLTPTAKTVRSAILIVNPKEGVKTVSSCFVMIVPNTVYGYNGAFIYADCGVVPEPTSDQLVDIAIASADSTRKLIGIDPVVALLSFSTKGSADAPSVQKVRDAYEMLKARKPDFLFDGEMQFDAAVVPFVAESKAPGSPAAGKANTMIFPDLNAGNISYKITQRLCNAEAYGPLLQGLSKPVNDLSRGASPVDIFIVSAITIVQSL